MKIRFDTGMVVERPDITFVHYDPEKELLNLYEKKEDKNSAPDKVKGWIVNPRNVMIMFDDDKKTQTWHTNSWPDEVARKLEGKP